MKSSKSLKEQKAEMLKKLEPRRFHYYSKAVPKEQK